MKYSGFIFLIFVSPMIHAQSLAPDADPLRPKPTDFRGDLFYRMTWNCPAYGDDGYQEASYLTPWFSKNALKKSGLQNFTVSWDEQFTATALTYTFDEEGNVLRKENDSIIFDSYEYNDKGQLTAYATRFDTTNFSYDSSGNLTGYYDIFKIHYEISYSGKLITRITSHQAFQPTYIITYNTDSSLRTIEFYFNDTLVETEFYSYDSAAGIIEIFNSKGKNESGHTRISYADKNTLLIENLYKKKVQSTRKYVLDNSGKLIFEEYDARQTISRNSPKVSPHSLYGLGCGTRMYLTRYHSQTYRYDGEILTDVKEKRLSQRRRSPFYTEHRFTVNDEGRLIRETTVYDGKTQHSYYRYENGEK